VEHEVHIDGKIDQNPDLVRLESGSAPNENETSETIWWGGWGWGGGTDLMPKHGLFLFATLCIGTSLFGASTAGLKNGSASGLILLFTLL
jgi:hypothetical protein